MDICYVKFRTLVCTALAVVTVTTIGILLNALFRPGLVA
jgi:hypothetical protein